MKVNSHNINFEVDTGMPYGVKPATGTFQRFIENAFANIPYTAVKVDDILISGKTDTDHLENIEKVFKSIKRNRCHSK